MIKIPDNKKEFGELIKSLRTQKKWSQGGLAQTINEGDKHINPAYIYMIESGKVDLRSARAFNLLSVFGYEVFVKYNESIAFKISTTQYNIPEILIILRRRANLSQIQMAEELKKQNISRQTIVMLEKGQSQIGICKLVKILQVLGCELVIKKAE